MQKEWHEHLCPDCDDVWEHMDEHCREPNVYTCNDCVAELKGVERQPESE